MCSISPAAVRRLIGGVDFMRYSFCKNSVFCAFFFVFFFLGTISGILLLQAILSSDCLWLRDYCLLINRSNSPMLLYSVWFFALPFLAAVFIFFMPYKNKLYPILFFLRGCVMSYSIGAHQLLELSYVNMLIFQFLLFPAFFMLCRRLWSSAPV